MNNTIQPPKIRRVITASQANEQLQELSLMYLCTHVSITAHTSLLGDYRNPIIHNKLKRMAGDLEDIKRHIKSMPVFKELCADRTDHIAGDFYELLHYVIQFSAEEVRVYNGVLKKLVEEAEARRGAVAV